MAIFMIATIKTNNKIAGIRLLETTNNKVMDVPYNNAVQIISAGKAKVENLKIESGKLVGVNGTIERYGVAGVSQSCTILNTYIDDKENITGYKVSDANGVVKNLSTENIMGIAEMIGVANGKIVDKSGTKFISAIEGSYAAVNMNAVTNTKNKETEEKKIEGKYKLSKGLIVDAETLEPICEHGDRTFNKIVVFSYGKFVVCEKYETSGYSSYKYSLIVYDVAKDLFIKPISTPCSIKSWVSTPDTLVIYGMRTGGYGQFYESFFVIIDKETYEYNIVKSNSIINKLVVMQNEDHTLLYDVAPRDIGAFSKSYPLLRIYRLNHAELDITIESEAITGSGDIAELDWVKWAGDQLLELCICAKVKGQLLLLKGDKSAVIKLGSKESEILGYDTLEGIVFEPTRTVVTVSKENLVKEVIAQSTDDRGIIIKVEDYTK